MLILDHTVLAALRKRRRAIAVGLWPALLASLLAGAACPAMSAVGAAADPHAAHHHEHAAHEHHAHPGTAPLQAPPTGDCPHCLGGHAAGNVPNAGCDVVAAAPPAPTHALPATGLVLPIARYAPSATSAIPPLIGAPRRTDTAPTASVPLHIRHCVLLI